MKKEKAVNNIEPKILHIESRCHRRWRRSEIKTLRLMKSEGKPYAEIAAALGRNSKAVQIKASKLGYTKPILQESHLNVPYNKAKAKLDKIANMPWYKRLFNWKGNF